MRIYNVVWVCRYHFSTVCNYMTRAKGLKVYLRTWNFSVLKEKGPKVILTPGSVDVLVCI